MNNRFVIIGGDAAGMSAASKARREDSELEIIVLEKSKWASYAACGLTYYIKGDIGELEDLRAIPPDRFRKERRIDLRLHHEVTRIDPQNKKISIKTNDGYIEIDYDQLLISTGAKSLIPEIEGIQSPGVFALHSMESAARIKQFLHSASPRSVVIIGGGYIGIEMAEALYARGIKVSLVEMLPHVLNSFGSEITEVLENQLQKQVKFYLGETVQNIQPLDRNKLVLKTDKNQFDTEMVILAVGVTPEVLLAKEAGIRLGSTGAIANDEYGRTNFPDIFTAGDCAEVKNIITGKSDYIPLALTANRHGRAIGKTVAGKPSPLKPVAGTAVVKAFHLEVARTGIVEEKVAEKHGFHPIKVTIDSHSRAGYYPESKPIKISLLADRKSKQVLGAAMLGEEGIAKRIDTVATALYGKFNTEQLENLDLAYSPPFSPVWDPVLIAARVLNKKIKK